MLLGLRRVLVALAIMLGLGLGLVATDPAFAAPPPSGAADPPPAPGVSQSTARGQRPGGRRRAAGRTVRLPVPGA